MTEERLAEIAKIKERKDYIERFLKKWILHAFPLSMVYVSLVLIWVI